MPDEFAPTGRQPAMARRSHAALALQMRDMMTATPESAHRISTIAARLGVSPFHLARVFRAEVGLSPHQFLIRQRMELAVERLRAGETNLSRLAADLGFSSHSHFTAVFRKHFGSNPAAARRHLSRPGHLEGQMKRQA